MTRVVRTDGGRFAVEWRSDARPYGWIRVSTPAAPNIDFATEAEAVAFVAKTEAEAVAFIAKWEGAE